MSLQHLLALSLIKNIGPKTIKNLIQYFGNVETIFEAKKVKFLNIEGIADKTADSIYSQRNIALEKTKEYFDFFEKHQIQILSYDQPDYPQRLNYCHDAPLLLYYRGTVPLNQKRVLSIVGTRNITSYGKLLCKQLVEGLKDYNVLVCSGLAHGVDAAAHKECVANKVPTIGVLGHGLDRIYPAAQRDLATVMVKNGGLLTEFLPGALPAKENFPQRNRIIAGMADATIVVEASIRGGALITAEIANSYNRDVYAFPGRANDEFSEGCNFLIKTNRAALINNAKDLIYYLGWDDEPKQKNVEKQIQLPLDLSSNERKVMMLIQDTGMGVDELAFKSGLTQSNLAMLLLTLEMKGLIVSLPGKMYKKS